MPRKWVDDEGGRSGIVYMEAKCAFKPCGQAIRGIQSSSVNGWEHVSKADSRRGETHGAFPAKETIKITGRA